jgi:Holliday junction resolvase RusA-like endonuclease
VTELLRAVIPGDPGPAKVNTRSTPIRRATGATAILSAPYRRWRDIAVLELRAATRGRLDLPHAGLVRVELLTAWPRKHASGPLKGVAFGDVDATGKAALDALEVAGVLYSDAQVIELIARKVWDRANPRIEIVVTSCTS